MKPPVPPLRDVGSRRSGGFGKAWLPVLLCWGALHLSAAEIHDLAESGDNEALKAALDKDDSLVNLKDKSGDLPLHHAVQKDKTKAVQILLEHGADINARGFDDWTPLHWAAKNGSKVMCKYLLENGADPKLKNGISRTPLQMATGSAAALLRELEAPPAPPQAPAPPAPAATPPPAPVAAAAPMPAKPVEPAKPAEPAKPVTVKAATAVAPPKAARADIQGDLFKAVQEGSEAEVKSLLAEGAKINGHNSGGLSPLMLAAAYGRPAVAKVLLEAGASPAASATTYQLTALHFAVSNGAGLKGASGGPAPGSDADYLATATALLEHKADANASSAKGQPLILAARSGTPEMVALLLDHGANIETVWSKPGFTPLIAAASVGSLPNVDLLLKRGAKLDARTPQGATALHIAAQCNQTAAITALVKAGIDVDARDHSNATPLIIAAATGQLEAVKTLIAQGAKKDAAANAGITALKAARQGGQKEVLDYLIALEVDGH